MAISKERALQIAQERGVQPGHTLLLKPDGSGYPRNTLAGNKVTGGWGITYSYKGAWEVKKIEPKA